MAKYVKLGDKANSFSCPTTGFTVNTKDQVKELTPKVEASKKVSSALKGGHLVYSNEEAFNNQPSNTAAKSTPEVDEDGDYTEESLKKLKLDELKVIAIGLLTPEHEETEEDVNAFTKKVDVIEFILDIQDEDEDEE